MAKHGMRFFAALVLIVLVAPTLGRAAPVELILDDGSMENSIGLNGGGVAFQFLWFNRFTPNPADFPIHIDRISYILGNSAIAPGANVELVVYCDPNGDPSDGAMFSGSYTVQVQVADGVTWNHYDLPVRLTLNGPCDVLIGVIGRYVQSGVTPEEWPAAIDMTASAGRSWLSVWSTDPPEPPVNPVGDSVFGTVDSFGFPGNWAIRAYGDVCLDMDGDGYGSPAGPLCTYPEEDCNDANADVYPGAPELCDLVDNQCPGDAGYLLIDEGCTDFVQVSPPIGAVLPQAPTLEWTADGYNLFLVTMRLPIRGVYWTVKLPWIPITVFDMSWLPNYSFVWCSITPAQPIYWWVAGFNTRTWRSKIIGPSVFFKAPPT